MAVIDKTTDTPPQAVPGHVIYRRVKKERLAYAATAAALAIAPQLDSAWPAHVAAGIAGAGVIARLWSKAKDTDAGEALLATYQRALPAVTGVAVYAANLYQPGARWWEILTPAAWAVLMGWLAPITRASNLTLALPDQTGAPALETIQLTDYARYRMAQWEVSGIAPDSRLLDFHQYQDDRPDFQCVIVAQQGKPVPSLTDTALAAAFDLPEGTVRLHPIDGSGPGRKLLTARPTLDSNGQRTYNSPADLWAEKVAAPGGAAPGMHLKDYRIEDNRIVFRVQAADGQLIDLPQKKLARALGMKNADLLMVETDGLGDGIVSVYGTHPLISIREATVEDLTMDDDGRIQLGLRHDGRPARMPLYDPNLGAITDLFVGAPGAGKSVTLNTILAAERISGVVSIVADAQDGMSLPEANGRTYHFGAGIAAVAASLAAGYEVAKYRQKVSSANGWGGFEIGNPWRLANITLDELNLILAEDADVPKDFKTWVVGLVAIFQSTGRKFGMGIRFAAQSIHLADLGDKDKIRANAKNGSVSLGRVNSSTTQSMATDGVVPHGVTIEPIPRYFRTGSGIDAAYRGEEEKTGHVTAGMANIIQGGSVFLMRTFKAVKKNKTFPGLIKLYEAAPIPGLTPEEDAVFRRAYAESLPRAEALLAGDTLTTDDFPVESAPAAQPQAVAPIPAGDHSIEARILDLLADGPMAIRDVRAALPDVAPGSVNNSMASLREKSKVAPVQRGVWQLAD